MEKFINVTQGLNERLQFFDYMLNVHVVFEVFLQYQAKYFCVILVFQVSIVDCECKFLWEGFRVEESVCGFCWIWDQIVIKEVGC